MLVVMGGPAVVLAPITGDDVPEVAAYLHRALNDRLSAEEWARSMVPPWACDAPNHGFHLRDGGRVVGAALAFYADRPVGDHAGGCATWGPGASRTTYQAQGLRLLRALLGQRDHTFTDLSPSGNVVALNERLKFRHLDTATKLVPNLPLPPLGVRAITDHGRIAARLTGSQRRIFDDHRGAAAARHVVLDVGGRPLYVVHRKDRRKGWPVFASILHVSDPDLLPQAWPRLSSHLLGAGRARDARRGARGRLDAAGCAQPEPARDPRCSAATTSRPRTSTTSTASSRAWRGERQARSEGAPTMRTRVHHLLEEAASRHAARPALTAGSTTRTYEEVWARHTRPGGGAYRSRRAPGRPGGGLPGQAHRDGRLDAGGICGRRPSSCRSTPSSNRGR